MIVDSLREELSRLEAEGLKRRHRVVTAADGPRMKVDGREVLAFCSNDYLGLASHPDIVKALAQGAKKWGTGSGASHLISGHQKPHEDLQKKLAEFVGMDSALLFSTGYMANLGIVTALLSRGDAVFADRLNHASLIDAVQLSRADHMRYPHADADTLRAQLAASNAKHKMILTDGVFSMDGDVAPLRELFDLAEKHDAWLVIDDAHGFGVLGPDGRGSVAHFDLPASPRIIYMGTLGKAAGVSGAFVAGHATVIQWLLQTARSHIFTTAAPGALAVALAKSVELIRYADDRRAHLAALTSLLRTGLSTLPWEVINTSAIPTPIQPILVGSNEEALRLSQGLFDRGFWVPAIRPPTVAAGKARLRITLSAAHTADDVGALVATLGSLA
jgi:8-amino-7-oxononanoate synthase